MEWNGNREGGWRRMRGVRSGDDGAREERKREEMGIK